MDDVDPDNLSGDQLVTLADAYALTLDLLKAERLRLLDIVGRATMALAETELLEATGRVGVVAHWIGLARAILAEADPADPESQPGVGSRPG